MRGELIVAVTGAPRSDTIAFCECVSRNSALQSFPFVIAIPPNDFDGLATDLLRQCGLLGPANRQLTHGSLLAVLERFLTSISSLQAQLLLIFDDAHQLGAQLIEQILQLTTFRREGRAALQVLFVGDPSLIEMLDADDLRQSERYSVKRYELDSIAVAATNTTVTPQPADRFVSVRRLAVAASAALVTVALTITWAVRDDVVPSASAANVLETGASVGYMSPAISPPSRALPIPPAEDLQRVALADILTVGTTLAEKPDVRSLVKLRDDIAGRAAQATGAAEREAIETVLRALEGKVDEARRFQLEIDRRRLAGDAGDRSESDAQWSR